MSKVLSSGIQTSADGQAIIPSSKRADGSTRREIRVRPGYKPPEDVERYKTRNLEAPLISGAAGVPGVDMTEDIKQDVEGKNKNAKRREAARRKRGMDFQQALNDVHDSVKSLQINEGQVTDHSGLQLEGQGQELDGERQKKIRNQLKKLKAVRELRAKKDAGEKLSADQLIKISKESEIIRDLAKLDYTGPELENESARDASQAQTGGNETPKDSV